MSVEHHDLVHEFPEFRERIHQLKVEDAHFRKLFEEYHELTREIENMENEVEPTATQTEEQAKLRRLHLKDALYCLLSAG
ncbi:YdcH family protein [Haliea atlantica]|nr:GTP-binding protein [Haliea sp.]|tara:strand:+ start:716 stop:955 length:240 start_codon:yes stop_codon:yes gene_type:complete